MNQTRTQCGLLSLRRHYTRNLDGFKNPGGVAGVEPLPIRGRRANPLGGSTAGTQWQEVKFCREVAGRYSYFSPADLIAASTRSSLGRKIGRTVLRKRITPAGSITITARWAPPRNDFTL